MKQNQKAAAFYAQNLLSVLFRVKNDTGRLEGMDALYTAIQPFTTGDFTKPKTRLKQASKAVKTIVEQVDSMRFNTFTHILCDNLRVYLRDLSQALAR